MASEILIDDKGVIPAIAQDAFTGRVLMIAYMNDEAIEKTVQTGQAWFYSRSRQEIWHKGETSGNFLDVRSIQMDCDGDALLLQVYPHGPACHTGNSSCFYQELSRIPEFSCHFSRKTANKILEFSLAFLGLSNYAMVRRGVRE